MTGKKGFPAMGGDVVKPTVRQMGNVDDDAQAFRFRKEIKPPRGQSRIRFAELQKGCRMRKEASVGERHFVCCGTAELCRVIPCKCSDTYPEREQRGKQFGRFFA